MFFYLEVYLIIISLPNQSVFAAVKGNLLSCMSSETEFGFVLEFL